MCMLRMNVRIGIICSLIILFHLSCVLSVCCLVVFCVLSVCCLCVMYVGCGMWFEVIFLYIGNGCRDCTN